jgi:nicotinamide riboside transporter PnuC
MNAIKQQAARAHTPTLEALNGTFANITYTVNNHAEMIDTMYAELNDLKGFYMWVTDTYPEHMQQYRAVLDLKRASE